MPVSRSARLVRIRRARLFAVAALVATAIATSVRAEDAIPIPPPRPIPLPAASVSAPASAMTKSATPPAPESSSSVDRPIAVASGTLTGDAIRTIVALAAVLGLALVLKRVVKRMGDPLSARRPSGVVQVMARFPFGKGQQVVLLSVGSRVLCVHQGGAQVRTLCEISDADEIALLRSRIEAGTPGRELFDRALTRSLERDPAVASVTSSKPSITKNSSPSSVNAAGRSRPAMLDVGPITETIDLTRSSRRPAFAMLGFGVRA